jgi:hypothetical protein|tara:strand:- start:488 stop:652 length:165 start_codon:yes stop_codon:yes gene_type:complete
VGPKEKRGGGEIAIRDNRSDVKQTMARFRAILMTQGAASAKRKFGFLEIHFCSS